MSTFLHESIIIVIIIKINLIILINFDIVSLSDHSSNQSIDLVDFNNYKENEEH